ncbi:MAG TPA: DUF488 domain-containing protein [Tepidisphaeraceae bacterium]|jgi:uncharacterized protein (DUF488 family)|nr:DUF488 domain-containing protein [Tepidisphaeraceae bacterium]
MPRTVFTIGHSTRPWPEFLEILQAHRIGAVADVRQFPGSRRFPHFNAEALSAALPAAGIDYLPFRNLGGRRKPLENSPNAGWRHPAFRGYADYMQTPEFASGIEQLQSAATIKPTAIMCSEAVPWRCHRSLIADAMLVRGWQVMDIFDQRQVKPHAITPFAVVSGTRIVYPLHHE